MLYNKVYHFFLKYFQRKLTKTEINAIKCCIDDHGININGKWMIQLFDVLLGHPLNEKFELLDTPYPNGDMGFTNLMADLREDFEFDLGNFKDEGECITWDLKSLNLIFHLTREGPPNYYIVEKENL